jgi:hypothetical protein
MAEVKGQGTRDSRLTAADSLTASIDHGSLTDHQYKRTGADE